MDAKKVFADMPRTKVNITLDVNNDANKRIVGLDYNAFEGLELDTLIIKGSGQFYCLDKALHNTNLQTLKYSDGITLDIADNAINTEYKEEII